MSIPRDQGATLRRSDDRCPAITASGAGAFPLTGGRGSPSKDSPKALLLSGLSFRPNPCPLSACQGALGCHLPESGDVTGKECGGWGQVKGTGEAPVSHLGQAVGFWRQCSNSEYPFPLQGP